MRLLPTLFLLLGLLAAASPCPALEVRFVGSAAVDGAVVRLGDIAGFDREDDTVRALASQVVAQAPAPGEELVLATPLVIKSLQADPDLPADVQWHGAAAVTVQRQGIRIGPDQLQDIIADYLRSQQSALPEAEVRFLPQSLPLPFTLPTGDLSHEVIPSNPGVIGSARMAIIFRVDGKVVKNISLRGRVEALAAVIVAADTLPRGTILRPEQLVTATLDLADLQGASTRADLLVGRKLTRGLRPGSPILAAMVEELPVVTRGELVKILYSSGPLQVTASGLAQSDGQQGQVIRVQNSSSNKIIQCRVSAPGLVEVLL